MASGRGNRQQCHLAGGGHKRLPSRTPIQGLFQEAGSTQTRAMEDHLGDAPESAAKLCGVIGR
jgi:hypothetical protein